MNEINKKYPNIRLLSAWWICVRMVTYAFRRGYTVQVILTPPGSENDTHYQYGEGGVNYG